MRESRKMRRQPRRRIGWALRLPGIYLVLFALTSLYALNALSEPCQDPDCLSSFNGSLAPGVLLLPWIDWIHVPNIWIVYCVPLALNAVILAAIGIFIDGRLAK